MGGVAPKAPPAQFGGVASGVLPLPLVAPGWCVANAKQEEAIAMKPAEAGVSREFVWMPSANYK